VKPCQSGAFTRQTAFFGQNFPVGVQPAERELEPCWGTLFQIGDKSSQGSGDSTDQDRSFFFYDRPILRRFCQRQKLKRRRIDELPAMRVPTDDPALFRPAWRSAIMDRKSNNQDAEKTGNVFHNDFSRVGGSSEQKQRGAKKTVLVPRLFPGTRRPGGSASFAA